MFEKRDHMNDPMINLVCPSCKSDLYPFDNQDRFKLHIEDKKDLSRWFVRVECLICGYRWKQRTIESVFGGKIVDHFAWITFYKDEILKDRKNRVDIKNLEVKKSYVS